MGSELEWSGDERFSCRMLEEFSRKLDTRT